MSQQRAPGSQPQFDFEHDPALEAFIEARAERIAREQAFVWRFRLVTIETLMMGALVLAAGLALGQPAFLVLRASVMVAAGCFASGILLLSLSGVADRGVTHIRRWRDGK
ncbi:hypothetical protein [Sphingobium cupriresistens]|uniref:hypothetical protein n=1 Tax=Sphingobium cupriresistens TaxID=1132417 RepID=UPI003BADCF1A